jgi:hypothetical protein
MTDGVVQAQMNFTLNVWLLQPAALEDAVADVQQTCGRF